MRALSLAALTVLEASALDAIGIAARCGYSHVGLRAVAATPAEPQPAMLADPAAAAAIRAELQARGIGVLDVEIVRLTERMDWDLLARLVAFAQSVGAGRMLVADNDSDPMRSRDNLARLAELAVAAGVVACLEAMPWTCAPDLNAARERVEGIANAALLVDAFHLVRSGGSPAALVAGEPAISYLQLCDIVGPVPPMADIIVEARSDRLFPGEGEVDLVTLLRKFPGLPVSVEVPADRLRLTGVGPEVRARMAREAALRVLGEADGDT